MAKKNMVSVTIQIKKDTHTKVLLKQINKFDKNKTVAEVCALAVEKGVELI